MLKLHGAANVIFAVSFAAILRFSLGTSCNVTHQCSIRYEFASEVHYLRKYKTCQEVYDRDCICKQPIDVLFNEAPPYIFTSDKNETVGIIPGLIKRTLEVCCFSPNCTQINYLRPYKSSIEALMRIIDVTALTPFVSQANTEIAMSSTYIPIMKTKGVAYVAIQDMSYAYFSRFFRSVGSNWPLFCISLLLALDAGIIVWILDCYNNSENFPRRFQTGVLEGFWWAYVSMTTVGYGDKTPKSFKARLFGILWITIGISVCGVFTASLTTGMTQSLQEEKINIDQKKIGVVNTTRYELNIAMRERATVQIYKSFKDLKDALVAGEVEGILLDDLALRYYMEELQDAIQDLYIRRNAIKNSETSYGILFPYDKQHNTTNAKWSSFLSGFFKQNQDNLDVLVELAMRELPNQLHAMNDEERNAETASLFNFTSVYEILLRFIGYATLVLVIMGYFSEKLQLMLRFVIAWRQDKWMNKVGDADENDPKPIESNINLNHQTAKALHHRFKVTMKEIQSDNREKDYSEITEVVEEKVFQIVDNVRTINDIDQFNNGTVIELKEAEATA